MTQVEINSAARLEVDVGGAKLVPGPKGDPGAVFTPSVSGDGVLRWTNDGGLENPQAVDITGPAGPQGVKGDAGPQGPEGTVFVPALDTQGNLSWSNDGGLTNPATVNIRGPKGDQGDVGAAGPQGPVGADGGYYTPDVEGGVISWTPSKGGMPTPSEANIQGPQGPKGDTGEAGGYYTPSVDVSGNLSWSASAGGMPPVQSANIRGPQGPAGADGAQGVQGPQGPQGPKGDPGTGLDILGQYDSLDELQAAVTEPEIGDNYYVGAAAPYSIYTWTDVGGTAQWLDGGQLQGAKGDAGGYYVPSVDGSGNLSWSASEEGMPAVQGANIRGDQGETGAAGAPGEDGATFTPSVDGSGNLSWTNDKGLPNPTAVNITGPQGAAGAQGAPGADGGYYTPAVDSAGNLTWSASKSGMAGVNPVNIMGPAGADGAPGSDGAPGEDGGYYVPTVNAQTGALSWSASQAGMPSVPGANIRGPQGPAGDPGQDGADATINGVSALTLQAGSNVELDQSGSTLTINAKPSMYVNVTGSEGSLSADRTNSEIYAAYQAGAAVYAIWEGMILSLLTVSATSAQFVYTSFGVTGSLTITNVGGNAVVYGTNGAIDAEVVAFDDSETNLGASNVQDAIYKLMEMLGLVGS